jgi:hypothetical protein
MKFSEFTMSLVDQEPIARIHSLNWPIINLSYFTIILIIYYIVNSFFKYDLYMVKICFAYNWHIVHIWSTNNLYMDIGRKVWILVLKYTLHCLTHPPTTLLSNKSYNFFGFIIITQTFFINQTLTYILFLMSCSNETNENSFLNFFQGSTHI